MSTKKTRYLSSALIALSLLAVPLTIGCAGTSCCVSFPIRGNDDSVHYLIVGVGLVTVSKPEKRTAAMVTKMQAVGVSASDQPGLKLGVGYASSSMVAVPADAEDVRVEVSDRLGGPLVVETQAAKLGNASK